MRIRQKQKEEDIAILEETKDANNMKINRTQEEKNALEFFTEDDENQNLDQTLAKMIHDKTFRLYKLAKDNQTKPNDPEYDKLASQDTLVMLNEIESVISSIIDQYSDFQKLDRDNLDKLAKDIRNEKKKDTIKAKKENDELMIRQRNEAMQLAREQHNFKKIGKMAMRKFTAPKVKRTEVKVNKLTQEEEDFIKYGLDPTLAPHHEY